MKYSLFVILLSLCFMGAGCTDISGENEVLFLTVDSETEIHVTGQENILDLADLEAVARTYLRLPGRQSYVILRVANPELLQKVKATLMDAGVSTDQINTTNEPTYQANAS